MEERKILIIGDSFAGKSVLSKAIEHGLDAVIVTHTDDGFNINDKRYTKRPEKPIKGGLANLMIRQYTEQYFKHEFTYSADSFIIEQYRLIQGKKCKLSKSRRDKIEKEFNRRFQLIKETK